MIKSYDYILGNGKFTNWFDIITGVIICSAMSFSLTEVLFSFNFKFKFSKSTNFYHPLFAFFTIILLFYKTTSL